MTVINIITTCIAFLALALSAYNFYLQRSDKKPKIKVSITQRELPLPLKVDAAGGSLTLDAPVMMLYLSNPSERDINIRSINFVAEGRDPIQVQPYSRMVAVVPSHSGEEVIILAARFHQQLRDAKWFGRTYGVFEVADAIGNTFRSEVFGAEVPDLMPQAKTLSP